MIHKKATNLKLPNQGRFDRFETPVEVDVQKIDNDRLMCAQT
mgnify:CR=1 FL=1